MSDIRERQTTDSKQGGEGTTSLHNKGWDFLSKNIDNVENTAEPLPPKDQGTK
ncbi:MAG: hypothetical protein GTO41_11830 [Burkholderiales bacterium]|nr:hypothetical protein [Burkholderiales bacterium]